MADKNERTPAEAPSAGSPTPAVEERDIPVKEVGGKVAKQAPGAEKRLAHAVQQTVDEDPLATVPTYAEREAYPAKPPVHADPTSTQTYGPSGVPVPTDAAKGMEERARLGIPEPPKPAGGTVLHDTTGGYQITPEGMTPEDVGPSAVVGPYNPRTA